VPFAIDRCENNEINIAKRHYGPKGQGSDTPLTLHLYASLSLQQWPEMLG
jgi:hypothetical protein